MVLSFQERGLKAFVLSPAAEVSFTMNFA